QLGGAFGTNLLATTLERRLAFHGDMMTAVQANSSATSDLLRNVEALLARAGVSSDVQAAGALHYLGDMILAQASAAAFRDSFFVVGMAFVVALAFAFMLDAGEKKGRRPEPTKQVQANPLVE